MHLQASLGTRIVDDISSGFLSVDMGAHYDENRRKRSGVYWIPLYIRFHVKLVWLRCATLQLIDKLPAFTVLK